MATTGHEYIPSPLSLLTCLFPIVTEPGWSSSPEPPGDLPGPPLAHPPLVLCLLVVVLVVAVVPPPGCRSNHSPGLARGIVGAVFCTGAGQKGDGHLGAWPRFWLQEVWRQQSDTSEAAVTTPNNTSWSPTPVATSGREPLETRWPWRQKLCPSSSPVQEVLELREPRA